MAFYDLREFIDAARKIDDVLDLRKVDWNLEIGALTEIFARREEYPLLLFDEIVDYPKGWRVASNIISHYRRAALALGLPLELSKVEMLRRWKERMPDFHPVPPRFVNDGPLFENTQTGDDIDLWRFPAPRWHELDGGRYIGTCCCVYTREPDADWLNGGIYRVQAHDAQTLGIMISPGHHGRIMLEKYWARGETAPIAISFGQEPVTWFSSGHSIAYGASEYELAGWMRDEPVEVVAGPITGIPLPATAEIAIEGEAPPPAEETRIEGPFGEWTGYYGHGARPQPIIRVKAVYHRNEPILGGAPPMKPPAANCGIPFAGAGIWQYLEKADIPDVRGVWSYSGGEVPGAPAPFTVVSITQRYAGHAQQTALAVIGSRGGAYHGRFVIVVDDDIDPANIAEVLWALTSRVDPKQDVTIIDGCWSTPLDTILHPDKKDAADFTNSRLIINACRPYHWKDRFPPVNVISREFEAQITEKWKDVLQR
jgi:4-hydroxy-3-polyprenylbenzoate decarboxylase